MSLDHNVAIIPHWVYETLKRNSMNIGDCLDFSKIRKCLSANDLACFLAVQDSFGCMVGGTIDNYAGKNSLFNRWAATATSDGFDFLTCTIMALAHDPAFISMAKDRLYSEDGRQDHHKEPFIKYELDRGVSGLVVYPGFYTPEGAPALYTKTVVAVLGALYVNSLSPNFVSATSWFRRYLELLVLKIKQ